MLILVQDEIERLSIQHQVLCKVFDNRLLFPPLTNPTRILDCGYGTASWAIDVAEEFPHCDVSLPK
jgi:ubiquinone/menaquinone biosynthesis C-methylase UbiE